MALDHVNGAPGKRERPIHLSFDVDALDPTVAPSTGTPVSDDADLDNCLRSFADHVMDVRGSCVLLLCSRSVAV